MKLSYQSSAIQELKKLADSDRHSIIISGIAGSGKTYLANEFAKYLHIFTFHSIAPKVANLKELISDSYKLSENQVICIENLDKGVPAASQVILKYLEEPLPNVYVIITCNNISKLTSTVLSRSIQVNLNHPDKESLNVFARSLDARKYELVNTLEVYDACKSLSDIRNVMALSLDKLKYYEAFTSEKFWSQSIDQIIWQLGHFPDNSKLDVKLGLQVIFATWQDPNDRFKILSALMSLEQDIISEHAVLSKLVLSLKG